MRDLSDFLPKVMPFALNCPEPAAIEALRDAAQEWCRRTRMWREWDEFQTTGEDIESVSVPPGAQIFEIEQAWFDGRPLTPGRFDRTVSPWGDREDGGYPRCITTVRANEIMLRPRCVGMLRISMFMMPSEDGDTVPDELFDRHASEMGKGALAKLLLLPNQPYTNPKMAMLFRQEFDRAADANFGANLRGQQRANVRTRPSFF